MSGEVAARLTAVNDRIAAACTNAGRDRSSVRLVAVGKRQPMERLHAAYEAGQRVFGENFVQALVERQAQLPADAEWHLVGHLQTNKARRAAAHAALIQTVDSARLAAVLGDAAAMPLPVLIEVNIGGEEAKSGVAPDRVEALITELKDGHENLQVCGLMAIPPRDEAPRRWFAALRALRDRLSERTGLPLSELSMGMSADFEDAVLEGATLVRVGTAIFGPRP